MDSTWTAEQQQRSKAFLVAQASKPASPFHAWAQGWLDRLDAAATDAAREQAWADFREDVAAVARGYAVWARTVAHAFGGDSGLYFAAPSCGATSCGSS